MNYSLMYKSPYLILIRWLVEAGVRIASEKKHRLLSNEIVSTDIRAEEAPLPQREVGKKCKQVPWHMFHLYQIK